MRICLCIDKKNGMMFFGKRQSQDRIQREKMLALVGENNLFMSSYSKSLFENSSNIIVDENFLNKAGVSDYCFVEDKEIDLSTCSTIVLYKWNRLYPADKFFDYDLKKMGYKLISKLDFVGSSHEKITEEIYEK
jgi:hypothetical protein